MVFTLILSTPAGVDSRTASSSRQMALVNPRRPYRCWRGSSYLKWIGVPGTVLSSTWCLWRSERSVQGRLPARNSIRCSKPYCSCASPAVFNGHFESCSSVPCSWKVDCGVTFKNPSDSDHLWRVIRRLIPRSVLNAAHGSRAEHLSSDGDLAILRSMPTAVRYAGVSPGICGLYQINIQIPNPLADGNLSIGADAGNLHSGGWRHYGNILKIDQGDVEHRPNIVRSHKPGSPIFCTVMTPPTGVRNFPASAPMDNFRPRGS